MVSNRGKLFFRESVSEVLTGEFRVQDPSGGIKRENLKDIVISVHQLGKFSPKHEGGEATTPGHARWVLNPDWAPGAVLSLVTRDTEVGTIFASLYADSADGQAAFSVSDNALSARENSIEVCASNDDQEHVISLQNSAERQLANYAVTAAARNFFRTAILTAAD